MSTYKTLAIKHKDRIIELTNLGLSKVKIAKDIGVHRITLDRILNELNLSDYKMKTKSKGRGNQTKIKCKNCDNLINRSTSGYCKVCYPVYFAEKEANKKYEIWLKTGYLRSTPLISIKSYLRKKLLEHYGNKCSICGIPPNWNGMELTLILDHIDGDASNDSENNLRFVCPNCDSQLETYKSKNRNSARNRNKTVDN